MANPLARFTITPNNGGYALRIESNSGEVLEVVATEDQLDVLAEQINRLLDAATIDDEDWDEADGAGGPDEEDNG